MRSRPRDDVLHAQGTPTEINTYGALDIWQTWGYGDSRVTLDELPDGLVMSRVEQIREIEPSEMLVNSRDRRMKYARIFHPRVVSSR